MKCQRCGIGYPDRFLQPLISSSQDTIVVDPECALKEMSDIHGIEFTKFHGEMSQQMLEEFQAWKEKNETKNVY